MDDAYFEIDEQAKGMKRRGSRPPNFGELQSEVAHWSARNFPNGRDWHCLLGIQEELGELSHAYLKREQGIRGTREEHTEAIKDAIGDLVVYLADFCARSGIDLEESVSETWKTVQLRDWLKNKGDGVSV
jgi:NTP pyrophosphatase (non-canonical NTP hydrolase)